MENLIVLTGSDVNQVYVAAERQFAATKADGTANANFGKSYWICRFVLNSEPINFTVQDALFVSAMAAGDVGEIRLRATEEEAEEGDEPITRLEFLGFTNALATEKQAVREIADLKRALLKASLQQTKISADDVKAFLFAQAE